MYNDLQWGYASSWEKVTSKWGSHSMVGWSLTALLHKMTISQSEELKRNKVTHMHRSKHCKSQ